MGKNEFVCDCTAVHEDIVDLVRGQQGDAALHQNAADFFKVLGDTTRVRIISALDCHEMCVCDIASLLSMTKSAVSHQLAVLRRSGFAVCRRQGKTAFYSLADAHIKQILEAALEHIQE